MELLLTPDWWQLLLLFMACSLFMISRLDAVEKNGFEGTLIGTLVMPYFSGFPNLCFAYLILKNGSNGALVLENGLVNNVTNLTIILALPSILWGLNLFFGRKKHDAYLKINHLSLLLSILALIFFSAATWLVSKDGFISNIDGFMLVGIFLFWQMFHIFDVLKNNTLKNRKIKKRIVFDFILIGLCAWGLFYSIEGLIQWISSHGTGFFSKNRLGVLSGILMVVPNAFLAVYYSAVKRSEIAYSSQIGDCHICIPLCIGLFAIFSPIKVPPSFEIAIFIIIGASAVHFLFTAFLGRLPRFAGMMLAGLYIFFIYKEII
ncbi:MAG: sodium:calcium symporter [Deltaproteobacteria bacterium]|nr:sodium:calcium symporter [Deltaproteobacteria bacterium]